MCDTHSEEPVVLKIEIDADTMQKIMEAYVIGQAREALRAEGYDIPIHPENRAREH